LTNSICCCIKYNSRERTCMEGKVAKCAKSQLSHNKLHNTFIINYTTDVSILGHQKACKYRIVVSTPNTFAGIYIWDITEGFKSFLFWNEFINLSTEIISSMIDVVRRYDVKVGQLYCFFIQNETSQQRNENL
jgi:hypothetical protein